MYAPSQPSAGSPPLREEPLERIGLLGSQELQVEGLASGRAQPPGAAVHNKLQSRLRGRHGGVPDPGGEHQTEELLASCKPAKARWRRRRRQTVSSAGAERRTA